MQVKNLSNNDFFKNSKYVVSVRAHKTWEPLYRAIRDKTGSPPLQGNLDTPMKTLKDANPGL